MNNPKITTLITYITITTTTLSCQLNPPNTTTTGHTQETAINTITEVTPISIQEVLLTPSPTVNFSNETNQIGEGQIPTLSPIVVPTATSHVPLIYIQPQSPVYLANFLHPELGCNWTGVAGQIFDTSGALVNGLIVEISGNLAGMDILALGLTGTSLPIGPGGFEIKLADHPFDSQNSLNLRIFDQNGNQLNEALPLVTYSDCRKNLMLINFILLNQALKEKIYFPIIFR